MHSVLSIKWPSSPSAGCWMHQGGRASTRARQSNLSSAFGNHLLCRYGHANYLLPPTGDSLFWERRASRMRKHVRTNFILYFVTLNKRLKAALERRVYKFHVQQQTNGFNWRYRAKTIPRNAEHCNSRFRFYFGPKRTLNQQIYVLIIISLENISSAVLSLICGALSRLSCERELTPLFIPVPVGSCCKLENISALIQTE